MIEETEAEATRMAWLRFWLAASDWTPKEAAQVLIGIVPRLDGSVFFPGLKPPGTIYGEDGEPPAVTAAEKLLRPEAYRQTEAGPCVLRELWLRQQADRISRIALRIDPAKLERPADLISWALARGIVPPWLEHARADPSLARALPGAPSAEPFRPRLGTPRKRRQADPCPIPSPEMIARWPKLHARLEDGWEPGQWSSLKGRRALYPCYAHMLAFFQLHRSKSDQEIADKLKTDWPELKLAEKRCTKAGVERKSSFGPSTIKGWRRLNVASAILAWVLLEMQEAEPPAGLANLHTLLTNAEDSA